MKPFLAFAIGLWVNLHAQTQSQDWIDFSNRSDAEIINMLEKAVAALAESPAEEASNRVYILQMQEKTARQSFDQKTILLEGELAAAAAAKEAAEKAFSDLQTDSTSLSAKLDLYARSQQRLRERLDKFPFIEIVTQSDLERNRSQDVIKTKLMRECLTQFRTTVKSLFSQENSKVVNFQLVENSSKSMFRQVQLQAAKVLGIYLSPSEGDIKYTAAVAFRFGFEYASSTKVAANVTTNATQINQSFFPDQPTTNVTTNIIRPNSSQRLRSYPTTLSEEQVKTKVRQYGFYDTDYNSQVKGIKNGFELQQGGQVVFDRATGLMWQQSGSSKSMTYANAEQYIHDLNNRRFAGYNDWRLPTLEEAMSIMEPKKHGALYIDPVFGQTQRWIWTADRETVSRAWVIYFISGGCGRSNVGVYYVRAVR